MVNPIEELILFNKLSEETTLLGRKVKWHTLDGEEYAQALSSTPTYDDVTRLQLLKIEKLARAIDSIDGQTWVSLIPQDKQNEIKPTQKARETISKWQRSVIDFFYFKFEQLESKSNKILEDLEKNFQLSLTNSASSGK